MKKYILFCCLTILITNELQTGYWLYHCHVLPHSMTGMSLVFQVGDERDVPPTPTGFPTCGNFQPSILSSSRL